MMRCSLDLILSTLLSLLVSLPLDGQSRDGARRQMNQGNYSEAVTMLSALAEIYPGQYSYDLAKAKKCWALQRKAIEKFQLQRYTDAELLYNQILILNPEDSDSKQAIIKCREERNKYWANEYARCKTVGDYRSFVSKYPDAPDAESAKKIIEEHDLALQDEAAWHMAIKENSASSYTSYIIQASSNHKEKHFGDAYRNRARLHFKDNYYASALRDYNTAKKHNAVLLPEDKDKYNASLAEQMFYELKRLAYNSSSVVSYLDWASKFLSNTFVAPHLHIETAYAMLVDKYCIEGNFIAAKNTVNQNFDKISSSYFQENPTTLSDWKKFLKARKKDYKKRKRHHN